MNNLNVTSKHSDKLKIVAGMKISPVPGVCIHARRLYPADVLNVQTKIEKALCKSITDCQRAF